MEDDDLLKDIEAAFDAVEEREEVEEIEEVESEETETVTQDDEDLDQQGQEEQEEEAELEPILPPYSWSKEWKEKFKTWPREAQEQVLSRDAQTTKDYTQKSMKVAEQAKYFDDMERAVHPYREELARANMTPAQLFSNYAGWHNRIRENPVAGILGLAQQYGIDVRQLTDNYTPPDPQLVQMQQEIQGLRGQLQEHNNMGAQQVQDTIVNEANMFINAVDDKGNKVYPHVDRVSREMTYYIQQIKAQDANKPNAEVLKEAYQEALWANPDTRQIMIQQKRQSEEAERQAKAVEKARKAKKASASINGSPDSGISRATPDDLFDVVSEAYDEYMT